MIKVLIEGMTENKGGKETYILNVCKHLDKLRYDITFVSYNNKIAYEEIIKEKGFQIIYIPPRHSGLLNHRRALDKLFQYHQFDVLWAHKTTLSACEIFDSAKRYNVPVRIIHSHSSANMGGKLTLLMHYVNRKHIFQIANEYLACSKNAARWFYGKHSAQIMVNAFELDRFKFNANVRKKIREKFKIQDYFIIGHIGRFGEEKNHHKLLNVFLSYKNKNPKCKLILCGDGEKRPEIEQQIHALELDNDVILMGMIDNVNEILQAMDILVMPSLFEGLPFALLEAQSAGLKCIVSDTVSREADITGWNQFLPLDLSDQLWAEAIQKEDIAYNRLDGYDIMCKAGFDIVKNMNTIETIIKSRL